MKVSQTALHLAAAILLVALYNTGFFRHVLSVYPLTAGNAFFLASLAIGLTAVLTLLLTLIGWQRTTKPVLSVLFVLAAAIAYFTNSYNVVIDHTMITNIVHSNPREIRDLLSIKLLGYLLLLGILPAGCVWWLRLVPASWKQEMITKAKVAVLCVGIVFALLFSSSDFFFSFFREHETLRYYANPIYSLYSLNKYLKKQFDPAPAVIRPIGTDARIPIADTSRELVILVVGEAARADHFSLNGYTRPTNPLLQQEDVVSFSNVYSSGTATAFSVPCMFSIYPREQCDERKATATENLLDVLQHAGVHVLWRENNSDSKGVALRIPYQDFKQPNLNTMCDGECRDKGMLVGLQEYIDAQKEGDIVIVLHQMGNHGPAYYKRYPSGYERFTPVCATNQLNECTREEIANAYDNAILYTDAFLARAIALLKKNDQRFETAMVYVGDHGESLGEYGLYLHGLPYVMAPDNQKHVPLILWFGDTFRVDRQAVRDRAAEPFSHDNLFHTVLGLLEIQTSAYNPQLDITKGAIMPQEQPAPLSRRKDDHTSPDRRTPHPHKQEQENSGFAGYEKQLARVLPVWLLLHLEGAKVVR